MDTLIIKIEEYSEGGYYYDIYNSEDTLISGGDSLDGGLCTTTIENALEMATSQAMFILNRGKTMHAFTKEQKQTLIDALNFHREACEYNAQSNDESLKEEIQDIEDLLTILKQLN